MNNSVEALIPFKEEHIGLLKLHVTFFLGRGGEDGCKNGGKMGLSLKKGIFFEAKK